MNVLVQLVVLVGLLSGGVHSTQSRGTWSDCTRNRNSPMEVRHMDISPRPVLIPGDIQFSMAGRLTRPLGSTKMTLSVARKTVFGFQLPIPCVLNIGSCTYNDVCTMLDDMIRENWAGILGEVGRGIRQMLLESGINPNQCPQPVQTFNIDRKPLTLPRLPRVLSWFAAGEYTANIRLTENSSGTEVLCLNVELPIEESNECTGFFCW